MDCPYKKTCQVNALVKAWFYHSVYFRLNKWTKKLVHICKDMINEHGTIHYVYVRGLINILKVERFSSKHHK